MRAWAGSYTPHGRSQWALTFTVGAKRRESMGPSFLVIVFSRATLLREGRLFSVDPGHRARLTSKVRCERANRPSAKAGRAQEEAAGG
ncbi:hypothetical protein GCM10009757_29050 [Streptomyces cheonanensis]|uniref:Uncharacterized protein n=1 Tax=Streptomyces cheonanensis TaxID=312720 RepID=A0ABN2V709_9ACTN